MLKPDLYEPLPNPVYAAALARYGVVADPARVRGANRNGAVENAIGVFEHRIELRNLGAWALLRTHARVDQPGTVVLPYEERVFNPSRETHRILAQAKAIGPDAERLGQMLFAIEGRVGQCKLWNIVGLAELYPLRLVDRACARHRRGRAQRPSRQDVDREVRC